MRLPGRLGERRKPKLRHYDDAISGSRIAAEDGFPLTRHCWRDGGFKGTRPTLANMVRTAETLYWGGAAESRCRRLRMGVIAQWIDGRRMVARGAAIVAVASGVAA